MLIWYIKRYSIICDSWPPAARSIFSTKGLWTLRAVSLSWSGNPPWSSSPHCRIRSQGAWTEAPWGPCTARWAHRMGRSAATVVATAYHTPSHLLEESCFLLEPMILSTRVRLLGAMRPPLSSTPDTLWTEVRSGGRWGRGWEGTHTVPPPTVLPRVEAAAAMADLLWARLLKLPCPPPCPHQHAYTGVSRGIHRHTVTLIHSDFHVSDEQGHTGGSGYCCMFRVGVLCWDTHILREHAVEGSSLGRPILLLLGPVDGHIVQLPWQRDRQRDRRSVREGGVGTAIYNQREDNIPWIGCISAGSSSTSNIAHPRRLPHMSTQRWRTWPGNNTPERPAGRVPRTWRRSRICCSFLWPFLRRRAPWTWLWVKSTQVSYICVFAGAISIYHRVTYPAGPRSAKPGPNILINVVVNTTWRLVTITTAHDNQKSHFQKSWALEPRASICVNVPTVNPAISAPWVPKLNIFSYNDWIWRTRSLTRWKLGRSIRALLFECWEAVGWPNVEYRVHYSINNKQIYKHTSWIKAFCSARNIAFLS